MACMCILDNTELDALNERLQTGSWDPHKPNESLYELYNDRSKGDL